jgi:hypothetical protein
VRCTLKRRGAGCTDKGKAPHAALQGLSLNQDQLSVILSGAREVSPDKRDCYITYVGERLHYWTRLRDDQVQTAVADALHVHSGLGGSV